MIWLWLLLSPLFMAADRIVGSDLKNPKSIGNGLVLVALAATSVMGEWGGAALSATWLIYRNIPWRIGGTTTPRTSTQVVGCFLRHAMPACVAVPCAVFGLIHPFAAYGFLLYALAATSLNVGFAHYIDALASGAPEDPTVNANIELARGAIFGMMTAIAVIGS